MRNKFFCCGLLLFSACTLQTQETDNSMRFVADKEILYNSIGEIPLPEGYSRVTVEGGSFPEWLRNVKLKKDSRVFLYNGSLKRNQTAQFAVLDMPLGNKDLQQCADAIMRLNAEYFFSSKNFEAISFHATDGTVMPFSEWRKGKRYKLSGNKLQSFYITGASTDVRRDFENYLQTVFSYAGTTSLAKELKPVRDISDVESGNVFIKPGFPGHAMLVADAARNDTGEKIFLLVQGYMPAQDIHVVKNPANEDGNPWYKTSSVIYTPEWTFSSDQLKKQ